jgi:cytochrome P450
MYGLFLGILLVVACALQFAKWTFDYYRDSKGLRRYPGFHPLAGITNIPYMILSHGNFRSNRLHELHSKGIPIIRTGPNSLSISDMRGIKDIYGHASKCTKDAGYEVQAGTHFHLADVTDKPDHARKRKILSSAYAIKNLEEWEFKVADKVERIIAQFDGRVSTEEQDTVIDYRPWTNYFTIDAISDIGLTHRTNMLDNGNALTTSMRPDGTLVQVDFRDCLYANSKVTSVLSYSYDWYKQLVVFSKILPYFNRLWQLNDGWEGVPRYLTSERLRRYQAGEKIDDFFEAMMHDRNGVKHNLELGEIMAEVAIMLNAGSTTTAISMSNVMYNLMKNPKCMARLQQEIDEALDEDQTVAPYETVKHLPYLRACLDESLRIFPPTSHGLTRATPAEGAVVAGDFIAGGTTVAVSAWVAHRDPSIFPKPEEYNPERFLGEEGKELGPYFVAFSAGARGCIGRNIAYLEQTVLLASLLHRYDFELADPAFVPGRLEWQNCHLTELPVKIRRRSCEKLE